MLSTDVCDVRSRLSPAIVLGSKNQIRLLVLNIRPVGIPARFLRRRPAVSSFLGVRATAAKLSEFAGKRGSGSIDSLVDRESLSETSSHPTRSTAIESL